MDSSLLNMDAPFTRLELMSLAEEILALDCSAKAQVHAEMMISVKEDEYSRSFFEAATRIRELMSTGTPLSAAVEAVAGYVPPVEKIEFKLHWWDCDIVTVTKNELYAIAAVIQEYDVPSPDRALATKISTKRASKEEWRLFALRYVDYKSRISDFNRYLWDFCSDINRTKKELAALKPWIKKACPYGDTYDVERPVMPPWRDTELWEADLDEWGYGDDFSPTFAPLPSSEIVPAPQNDAESNPAYNDEIVDNSLVDEEELEVAVLDPDVLEDEELYAAHDAEKQRLLADAIHLPIQLRIEHLSDRTAKDIPHIVSKSTVLTAKEKEQLAADSVMLTEAMSYSSFKEELKACEEAMKRDPDGKLLEGALTRLLDSQAQIEAIEMAAQNKSKTEMVVVTGSDFASTSSLQPPTDSLPDNLDVNAYSQLIAPHESEEEWPQLTTNKPAPTAQQQAPPPSTSTQPAKNIWVEKNKDRKKFMNAGIGGKLTHVKPTAPEFFVDVSKALSIQDIWGFSLLGQYVGHNPGHFLINSMIKSWGVRAKYKLEEGWFIFSFESEVDREKVLIGGPYLIHGRPMLLKNIPDKFAFNRKYLALVPLWVRIYGLASRFWTPDILGGIASYIGCPMYMDPVTDSRKRNAYARVLVEVNLAAPVTKTVPIKFSDGDVMEVNFLVENMPKFCTACCSYGHVSSGCLFQSEMPSTAAKNMVQKPAGKSTENGLENRKNNQQNAPSTAAKDGEKSPADKPPGQVQDARLDSQNTSNTAAAANNNHGVLSSIQKDGPDVVLNRGESYSQQQSTPSPAAITAPKVVTCIQDTNDVALDREGSQLQQQHAKGQTTDSAEIAIVNSELDLANQFAALNGASEQDNYSGDVENGEHATYKSEDNNDNLATGSVQPANGDLTKKKASSTAAKKTTKNDAWHTTGPSTRSRKKHMKP